MKYMKKHYRKSKHLSLKRGFNLIEEWDCSLNKKRRSDKDLDEYFNERWDHHKLLELHGGVVVKDSFFGGRTNNIKFFCDVSKEVNSRILYYDFRSLYPTVLKYSNFPVGHPEIINENLDVSNFKKYFGFAKCIIEAPKTLRIPVLPMKIKNKLIFPLCKLCAENKNQNDCEHNDEERYLIGTWTTVEINAAIERGYKIISLLEVYHYKEYTKDIFSEYVNLWLKFKQQSDGWPNWIQNDADKQKYIDSFIANEGVALDQNEIRKNPALRYIAKLFLNTLWGKLAQRPNLPQTTVCNEYNDYWEIFNDEDKDITGELMINEDCLLVTWQYNNDLKSKNNNTSIATASFCTSHARVKLLEAIDEIEVIPGRLLYMDTDSMIFKYTEGEPKPEIGDYLGCLADEISKDYGKNAICTKFCSLGPKVYGMEIWPENAENPIVPIKIKGITLTHKVLEMINIEKMLELVKIYIEKNGNNIGDVIKLPQMQIVSNNTHCVETRYFDKILRVMSEKRRINGNDTLPYGFVTNRI